MAWIRTISPEQADGEVREEYVEAVRRTGRVAHVIQLSSLNPPALRAWVGLYKVLMFGPSPLSRPEREMVATVVSRENDCHY